MTTPARQNRAVWGRRRVIGKPTADNCGHEVAASPARVAEGRYAYYRRCRHFRRNGEQCKAPAMKGEPICYRHAEQADNERRREEQRREFLSRPGVGFGSFNAIQWTISELAAAIFAGAMDRKTAARLIVDILNAIRLQKMLALAQRLAARAKKPVRGRSGDRAENLASPRLQHGNCNTRTPCRRFTPINQDPGTQSQRARSQAPRAKSRSPEPLDAPARPALP